MILTILSLYAIFCFYVIISFAVDDDSLTFSEWMETICIGILLLIPIMVLLPFIIYDLNRDHTNDSYK